MPLNGLKNAKYREKVLLNMAPEFEKLTCFVGNAEDGPAVKKA